MAIMKCNVPVHTMTEVIKALIIVNGPKDFAAALNNACYHGEVFLKMDFEVNDESLAKLFDGIEKFREGAEAIETDNGY